MFESFVTLGGDKAPAWIAWKGIGVWLCQLCSSREPGPTFSQNMDPVGSICARLEPTACAGKHASISKSGDRPLPSSAGYTNLVSQVQPPWWRDHCLAPMGDVDPVSGVLGIPSGAGTVTQMGIPGSPEPGLAVNPHQCCWSQRCPRSGVAGPPLVQCFPLPWSQSLCLLRESASVC